MSQAESIQTLVEVTGLDPLSAKRVFEVCNNNLEQAINFHLEGNVLDDEVAIDAPSSAAASNNRQPSTTDHHADLPAGAPAVPYFNDEGVREPIPVKREQLVGADDDIFRSRIRRPLSHNVCPLRNFQLEGELQEAQLSEAFAGSRSESMVAAALSRTARHAIAASGSMRNAKRPRLGDLFRPPVDINYVGTLHGAKESGKMQDRWIIVNLQDNVRFASQVMNRDIWSDSALKAFIKKHFLFWQVAIDTSEGARFQAFYAATQLPYVCILDPRTGEEKRNYKGTSDENAFRFTASEFLVELRAYLDEHDLTPSGEDGAPNNSSTTKKMAYVDITDASPDHNGASAAVQRKRRPDTLDEEEQLRIAIENSLRETHAADQPEASGSGKASAVSASNGRQNKRNLEFDSDSDTDDEPHTRNNSQPDAPSAAISADYTDFLGAADDPITRLQLRLPDGRRDNLEWPCSSQIQALRTYVEHRYPEVTQQPYKIICAFPRKDLLTLDASETLLSAKLHPNALLHLHQDD